MTQLVVCTPTYKRYDLCAQMVQSARNSEVLPDGVLILDNGSGIDATQFDGCNVISAGYNTGVAKGWNILMHAALQLYGPNVWTLIVNDDIEFLPDTIGKFKQHINSLSIEADLNEFPILCGADMGLNAFSMFAVQPARLKHVVGWFDETIYPAYFDDNDMHYRLKLKGLDLYRIPNCTAKHNEGGSATIKAYTEDETEKHHIQFRRNQTYYILKWGGMPGEESYTTPFDSRDVMRLMQELHKNFGY